MVRDVKEQSGRRKGWVRCVYNCDGGDIGDIGGGDIGGNGGDGFFHVDQLLEGERVGSGTYNCDGGDGVACGDTGGGDVDKL